MIGQVEVLRAFVTLHELRPDWRGKIVLVSPLDARGMALAMACVMVGAVCLAMDEDPAKARMAMRDGCCDFVVTTLDEALRTMKNEVRKGAALSVGLTGDVKSIRAELMERGVVAVLDTARSPLVVRELSLMTSTAQLLPERREKDAELIAGSEGVSRRWLELAPRYFPRELDRSYF